METEIATHSSVLAWRIPGTAEPDGLPSMGSHKVRHDWSDLAAAAASKIVSSIVVNKSFLFFFFKWVNEWMSGRLLPIRVVWAETCFSLSILDVKCCLWHWLSTSLSPVVQVPESLLLNTPLTMSALTSPIKNFALPCPAVGHFVYHWSW